MNNKKGFTLIELLIIISIIGILGAIAISNFIHYRQRSYKSSCISGNQVSCDKLCATTFPEIAQLTPDNVIKLTTKISISNAGDLHAVYLKNKNAILKSHKETTVPTAPGAPLNDGNFYCTKGIMHVSKDGEIYPIGSFDEWNDIKPMKCEVIK